MREKVTMTNPAWYSEQVRECQRSSQQVSSAYD